MDVGTALAGAWSSGISAYAVLAVLGIAGRVGAIDVPAVLERPWVIGLTVVLALVDFVVDKVAWLDSVWDAVHTVVRPLVGGWLVASLPDVELPVGVAAAVGVALALSSHAAKASTRALVNASPEPVSNVVVSTAEDGLVGLVMALALAAPEVAAVVAVVLALTSVAIAVVLWRVVRRVVRGRSRATVARDVPPAAGRNP